MTYTIYHNPRCSKSRLALKLLRKEGVPLEVIKYLETPPAHGVLLQALKKIGREALLRKGEDAYYQHIRPRLKSLQDDELIDIMTQHPEVIERPLVVAPDGRMALGRPPENIKSIL